jgi:protein-S-isoprenylcysteine O-methyltransferase Ste14
MKETIIITFLSLLFLGVFTARNLIVKTKVKQRVRASESVLNTSILFTTICILTTIFSVLSDRLYKLLGAIAFLRSPIVSYAGFALFAISIVAGWFVSAHLKKSWRVGIHEDQRTELIINGIYKYVRNPYFVSYFAMFFSLFLVRPSIALMVIIAITVAIFHRMILNEERYLAKIHGERYLRYKETTGRYFPLILKSHSK